jgi:hypothetical protein
VERSGRGNDVFNLLFAMSTTLLFFFWEAAEFCWKYHSCFF